MQGDDAFRIPILVYHNAKLVLVLFEQFEHLLRIQAFGNEQRWTCNATQVERLIAVALHQDDVFH